MTTTGDAVTVAGQDPEREGLEILRKPFPEDLIEKLPRYAGKEREKSKRVRGRCYHPRCGGYHELPAVHLDYVGHAALTERLLDADLFWTWEPMATDSMGLPVFDLDSNGNKIGLWIRLTICGLTRFGFGSCDADANEPEKELIGDALRNAAMRFGAALELWRGGSGRDSGYVTEDGEPIQRGTTSRQQEPKDQDESGDPVMLACKACGHEVLRRSVRVFSAQKESLRYNVRVGDPIYRCPECGVYVPELVKGVTEKVHDDEKLPF